MIGDALSREEIAELKVSRFYSGSEADHMERVLLAAQAQADAFAQAALLSAKELLVGRYFWVRFKGATAADKDWQVGHVRKDGGCIWVAMIYSKAHFGLEFYEFGAEITAPAGAKRLVGFGGGKKEQA